MDNALLKIVGVTVSNYNLGSLIIANENNIGRNTHYILETTRGRYFIKTLNTTNENIRIYDEIMVCKKLRIKGMATIPEYIKRRDGGYLTQIDAQTFLNVQRFIGGDTWRKNEAPDWLLLAGADFIGDVHTHLNRTDLRQRCAIQRINDSAVSLKKIENIEQIIMNLHDSDAKYFLMNDISLRRKVLNKHRKVKLDKLTFVNGHSDYTVTQMITSEKKLVGVIDFSEVSNIPAIWEIMRFYLNSAPEIKEKYCHEKRFFEFLSRYIDKVKLNVYDKDMLMVFNLYYFCQALSVYDKLLSNDFSKPYMDRIISRNNIIRYLQIAI
jgi:hypothetical protein